MHIRVCDRGSLAKAEVCFAPTDGTSEISQKFLEVGFSLKSELKVFL